jgi:hypothetical protein
MEGSMKNEKTSVSVAKTAGRLLKGIAKYQAQYVKTDDANIFPNRYLTKVTFGELKALAASALTQSADKPKPKRNAYGFGLLKRKTAKKGTK